MEETGNWRIRPAESRDLKRIAEWLPQAFVGLPRPKFWVAEKAGLLLGAASLRVVERIAGGVEGRFLLFVEPSARRRGIGRDLSVTCGQAAAASPCTRLLAGQPVEASSGEAAFFLKIGLDPLQKMKRFEVCVEALWQIYRRILNRRPLAAGMRIVSLAEAPRSLVSKLIFDNLGGFADWIAAHLEAPEFQAHSRVVIRGAAPVAAMLVRADGGAVEVCSIAVDRSLRGTAVSPTMREAVLASLMAEGLRDLTFTAQTQVHYDTEKTALRVKGRCIEETALFGRILRS